MIPKYVYYIFILIGAIVGIYAEAYDDGNQLLMIVAVTFLMGGMYGIAKTIVSKKDQDEDQNQNLES